MSDLSYRIVYPRGDRSALSVAHAYDYEEDEYDIASSKKFDDRAEAEQHMHGLATTHNLSCTPRKTQLLD